MRILNLLPFIRAQGKNKRGTVRRVGSKKGTQNQINGIGTDEGFIALQVHEHISFNVPCRLGNPLRAAAC